MSAPRVVALETTADGALALFEAGRWQEAEQAYRELLGQAHVINYEYDEWLTRMAQVLRERGLTYDRTVVHLYLHYFDVAKKEATEHPLLLARIAEAEKRHSEAASLFRQAGLPMHAAVALERAGQREAAAAAWGDIVRAQGGSLRPYEAALVHFNWGMALAHLDKASEPARRALIETQRQLEQVADEFESSGEFERAFDCYQILLQLGRQSGQFENLAEGYVNCIRVLASDNLKFYALQYYEDFVAQALERKEYQAAATVLQEASAYAARVGLPYDRHYQTKAAKAWLRCAEHFAETAAPLPVVENAMLAAVAQFAAVGDFAAVRNVFEKLGKLDFPERARERYLRIAQRYAGAAAPKGEAPGLPDYLRQQQAYADIWFADLLEWEMAGDPAAVASSIVADLRYPNGIRRRALLILLTAAAAARAGASAETQTAVRLAGLLGELQWYAALAPLEKLFLSPTAEVRAAAVRALRYLFFKRSFVLVRRALSDADEAVRAAAVNAIYGLHFPHAFNPLARLCREHTEVQIVRAALESIGKIGSIEAADFLVGMMRQAQGPIREAALAALRAIDNPDAVPILRQHAEIEADAELREALTAFVRKFG